MLVIPRDFFHGPLLLPVSAPEKTVFSSYFPTGLQVRTMVYLLNALFVFTPATFLLDDLIFRGKRESEKERKLLRVVNLEFWLFFCFFFFFFLEDRLLSPI